MSQSSPDPNQQANIENASIGGQVGQAGGDLKQIQGEVIVEVHGDLNLITLPQTKIIQITREEIKARPLVKTSPYKGLRRFEPEDCSLFFGRAQFITGLVNDLEQSNLVLLLGASGSGKSSVIRAGLIPWLAKKWGTRFVNLMFTPDEDPFESLYASLRNKYKQAEARVALQADAETLTHTVKVLKQPEDYWLIFIDQFEELFTSSQREKRDRFIDSLVNLIGARESNVKLLFTMRADFLDRLSAYPSLGKLTQRQIRLMTNMQRSELSFAIEQPAAQHGVLFEDGLVDEIIKDLLGQAGYLPFLQYTLDLLWETEVHTGEFSDRILHISTYRQLGGVLGALQQHIDKIYDDFSKAKKLATQRILLKLVDIGGDADSGTEWKPVRRRTNRAEFTDDSEQQVLMWLIEKNLLVSDRQPQTKESTIEIAHEVLLTSWAPLNQWIQENRRAIALRNRLNEDVARWQSKKQDDELWGGSKLEQVLERRKDPTFTQVLGGFSPIANQFIDASKNRRERQRNRVIIGLVGFSAIALTLALDATKQRINAELKERSAKSELLASQGNQFDALIEALKTSKKLKEGFLLVEPDVRYKVIATLSKTVYGIREYNRLEDHKLSVTSVSFSNDGQLIASASEDKTIKLWSPIGKLLPLQLKHQEHQEIINSVSFSPDNQNQMIAASGGSVVKLWKRNGDFITSLEENSIHNNFLSISFSADSQKIAVASDDGTVKIWEQNGSPSKWRQLPSLRGHKLGVNSVKFSTYDQMIASASKDGTVRLWKLNGEHSIIMTDQGSVNSVSFSKDNQMIASAGEDGTVKIWSLEGKPLRTLAGNSGHSEAVKSVSFNKDGLLASASSDRTVKIWNKDGSLLATLSGHTDKVNDVTFAPDGQTVASASADNSIKLWRIQTKNLQVFNRQWNIAHEGNSKFSISPDNNIIASIQTDYGEAPGKPSTSKIMLWALNSTNSNTLSEPNILINSISFSPDGQRIIAVAETNNDKGIALLWDLRNSSVIQRIHLNVPSSDVNGLRFSKNGDTVAFACRDGIIRIWDLQSNHLKTLNTHITKATDISLSPNRNVIAISSNDNDVYTIQLWDLNGTFIRTLGKHRDQINSINFNSNGQMLVSGSNDGDILIWSHEGMLLKTLKGHNGWVNWVTFSPDDNIIASAGVDKTVKLWSRNGDLLQTLEGHNGEVLRVDFNHNGSELISIDKDNLVFRWNLNLEDLRTQGCEWLKDYKKLEEEKLCNEF
jgi:WD40 repeat protein